MTVSLYHFYHIWIGGRWKEVVTEHIIYLRESGLLLQLDGIYIGLVGSASDRTATKEYLDTLKFNYNIAAEADQGYEQVTLDALYEFSLTHDGFVFYAHNKGSYNISHLNNAWRLSMTYYCLMQWENAIDKLQKVDAVGCHWMIPHFYITNRIDSPFFGGNFWWARLSIIRTLKYCARNDRYDAEKWLGTNPAITIYDLNPGVPDKCALVVGW